MSVLSSTKVKRLGFFFAFMQFVALFFMARVGVGAEIWIEAVTPTLTSPTTVNQQLTTQAFKVFYKGALNKVTYNPPAVAIQVIFSGTASRYDGSTSVVDYQIRYVNAYDQSTAYDIAVQNPSGVMVAGSPLTTDGAYFNYIAVNLLNDVADPPETIVVSIGAVSPGDTIRAGKGSATITIINPRYVPPTVTIAATDSDAGESNGNTGTFTVTRSGPVTTDLNVLYALSGTATAGDYAPLSGSVLIPAGSSSANIVVTPIADTVVEPSETVIATISPKPNFYTVGAPASATVNIADKVLPVVSIAATDAEAAEPFSSGSTDFPVGSFPFAG